MKFTNDKISDLMQKINTSDNFKLTFGEFSYLMSKDYFKNILNTEKEVLIEQLRANTIGFEHLVDFAMNYSLKNRNEVVFCYHEYDTLILSDVVKGVEFGARPFLDEMQWLVILDLKGYGLFHTHCNNFSHCFGLNDIQLILDYESISNVCIYEFKLGLPKINQLLTLRTEDITIQIRNKLGLFTKRSEEEYKEGFHSFHTISDGVITYTEMGKLFQKNQSLIIKKILKPILKVEKWT